MSTKLIKLIVSAIFLVIIFSQIYVVKASGNGSGSGDGLWTRMENQINSFKEAGQNTSNQIDLTDVVPSFVELAQILMTIGAGVLVAVTIYMGIKYLTGGPEIHAKLKVQLVGLVVSGGVIFGAFVIWKTVLTFSSKL